MSKTRKNRMRILSVLTILLMLALIAGSTMAWFIINPGPLTQEPAVAGYLGMKYNFGGAVIKGAYDLGIETWDWQPGDRDGISKSHYLPLFTDSNDPANEVPLLVDQRDQISKVFLAPDDPRYIAWIEARYEYLDSGNLAAALEILLGVDYSTIPGSGYAALAAKLEEFLQDDWWEFATIENTGNLNMMVKIGTVDAMKVEIFRDVFLAVKGDGVVDGYEGANLNAAGELIRGAAIDYTSRNAVLLNFAIPPTKNNIDTYNDPDNDFMVYYDDDGNYYVRLAPLAKIEIDYYIDFWTNAQGVYPTDAQMANFYNYQAAAWDAKVLADGLTGGQEVALITNPVYKAWAATYYTNYNFNFPTSYISNRYTGAKVTLGISLKATQFDYEEAMRQVFDLNPALPLYGTEEIDMTPVFYSPKIPGCFYQLELGF